MRNKTNNTGKRRKVVGAITGAAAASLKPRRRVTGKHATEGTPIKLSGAEWRTVFGEVKNAVGSKNLPTLAAGVAYYATLAFFPFLAAMVAITALVISTEQVDSLIGAANTYLPADISGVIAAQLQNLVTRRSDNFLAAGVALGVALFGASGASKGLVTASNVAYGVRESRGWLTQQLWGILWTLIGLVFGVLILAILALNQTVLGHLGVLLYGRWLVLLVLTVSGLGIFYRNGPNRPRVRWQWVIWGAAIATIAWLIATSLFFAYVQNFANYTQSYSLFTGIIILMIWMNLSALIVLIGAEINHQLEVIGRKKWGGFLSFDEE